MAFETKDMSGALFRNDKGGNPARPDMRGKIKVGGVLYVVSAWSRTPKGKEGDQSARYLSLAIQPADEAPSRPTDQPTTPPADAGDSLPF